MNRDWLACIGLNLAATVMLLVALADLPYAYYQVLRVVVFLVTVLWAWATIKYTSAPRAWAWGSGVTAFLFNPVMPLHLNRPLWVVLNLGAAGFLLSSLYYVRRKADAGPQ